MKNHTRYAVTIVENGIIRYCRVKTWKNARKYIGRDAQSIFREKINKKGWLQELVWSNFD